MPQRGLPTRASLVRRWRRSAFHGAPSGLASVAVATAAVAAVCAVIALVVTLVY